MPDGAQAWKMIKPPGSQLDRIAQACDRCRSKKIRCDGLRPHCSNCMAVGFECKITDKLSRRAFPRGYTESLEDRVRQLEQENNKLMKLLDIKDEEMEMLSRVENVLTPVVASSSPSVNSTVNVGGPTTTTTNTNIINTKPAKQVLPTNNNAVLGIATPESDDYDEPYYAVKQINTLVEDGSYMGSSSGGTLAKTLIEKMRLKKLDDSSIYGVISIAKNLYKSESVPVSSKMPFKPSRISADRLVTIYFQEWHTMFSLVDQEQFMLEYDAIYESMVLEDIPFNGKRPFIKQIILLLMLSLGSLATRDAKLKEGNCLESWNLYHECKRRFTVELQNYASIETAQALCLSLLYALHVGNIDDIWHFRAMCVGMSQRLGLHRCHKSLRMSNGSHLSEDDQNLRRKVFWCLNSLECFGAAMLGAPRLIHERDIECAAPEADAGKNKNNIDLCALDVISYSKVLTMILNSVYSCTDSDHNYRTVVKLEDQLESWNRNLSPSMKFKLQHGRPTATLEPLHQKSPLLTMLYHYGKILIHLPALTGPPPANGRSESTRISGSTVNVTQSAKIFIQCYNYLSSRSVTTCLPVNPSRLVTLFGGILLYSALDYSKGGSLIQDVRNTLSSSLKYLQKETEVQWPSSVTRECLTALNDTCELVLNVKRRPSSSSTTTSTATASTSSAVRRSAALAGPTPTTDIRKDQTGSESFEEWLALQKEYTDLLNPAAYVGAGDYEQAPTVKSEYTSMSSSESIISGSEASTEPSDHASITKAVEELIGLDEWENPVKKEPVEFANEGATYVTMPSNGSSSSVSSQYMSIHSQILREDEADEDEIERVFPSRWLEDELTSHVYNNTFV